MTTHARADASAPADDAPPAESAESAPVAPHYTVAVRELCGFAARTGDLDLRFTPAPTAAEGITGHQSVVARRGAGYRAEVVLEGRHRHLRVRGRADGFDPDGPTLEEIKTHKGDVEATPENHRALHWAQAKVYAAMLCEAEGLAAIDVVLVYWHVGQLRETRITQHCSAGELRRFFDALCDRFIQWADQELAHRAARNAGLRALAFPHPSMRDGQRSLAEQVWRCGRAGRTLLVQAPTGIGKTMGTLFPLLKAAAGGVDSGDALGAPLKRPPIRRQFDKLFYLSAKGSARAMAVQALQRLRDSDTRLPLRVLELVARDDACVHPDKACHGDSCPLAQGFFDRLPSARQAAVDRAAGQGGVAATAQPQPGAAALLDATTVRAVAAAHTVCPYYLSQELVRWSDVVVGDVNYWFDSSALLHGLQQVNGWQVALLIDEAHNLLDRARGMYSAALQQGDVRHLHRHGPQPLRKAFGKLNRAWLGLVRQTQADRDGPAQRAGDARSRRTDGELQVLERLPDDWARALLDLVAAMGDFLSDGDSAAQGSGVRQGQGAGVGSTVPDAAGAPAADSGPMPQRRGRRAPPVPDSELMRFYFDALHFSRLLETLAPHSMLALSEAVVAGPRGRPAGGQTEVAIRNLLPAPFLQPRFAAATASVLFSATLQPPHFHQDTLGLGDDLAWLDVPAAFRPEQLQVHLVPGISTRWRDRARSIAPIASLMAQAWRQRPGNYLAFFSSFDYMGQVADALAAAQPELPQWRQERRMSAAERQGFLDRFGQHTQGIGFAVLGGQFGEGIDLPGRRLIGAFVATLGLPQFNAYNERVRACMQSEFDQGYDYTYLYPGLRKVVQAAGRVIRTPDDEGAVWLIDDRFASAQVQALLPNWWRLP